MKQHFSTKSDVYALGIIMWELATLTRPFSHMDFSLQLLQQIAEGLRPDLSAIPPDIPAEYIHIMKLSFTYNAQHRPSSTQLVEMFEVLCQELQIEDQV
jgi:serine/threonine protein kinase